MSAEYILPEARDLGQAILLLQVLGGNVQALTNEIRILRTDMATREELYQVRDAMNLRMDSLKAEFHNASPTSRLKEWAEAAQHIAVLFGVVASVVGVIAAVVHFWDRLPK